MIFSFKYYFLVILYLSHFAHSTFFGLFDCCSRVLLLLFCFVFFKLINLFLGLVWWALRWRAPQKFMVGMKRSVYYSAEVHAFQPYNALIFSAKCRKCYSTPTAINFRDGVDSFEEEGHSR